MSKTQTQPSNGDNACCVAICTTRYGYVICAIVSIEERSEMYHKPLQINRLLSKRYPECRIRMDPAYEWIPHTRNNYTMFYDKHLSEVQLRLKHLNCFERSRIDSVPGVSIYLRVAIPLFSQLLYAHILFSLLLNTITSGRTYLCFKCDILFRQEIYSDNNIYYRTIIIEHLPYQ